MDTKEYFYFWRGSHNLVYVQAVIYQGRWDVFVELLACFQHKSVDTSLISLVFTSLVVPHAVNEISQVTSFPLDTFPVQDESARARCCRSESVIPYTLLSVGTFRLMWIPSVSQPRV